MLYQQWVSFFVIIEEEFCITCLVLGMKSFRLHACREDGSLEAQMVELTWDSITRWESDEESMSFCFQYNRPDKPARWVKVYTPYVSFSFK